MFIRRCPKTNCRFSRPQAGAVTHSCWRALASQVPHQLCHMEMQNCYIQRAGDQKGVRYGNEICTKRSRTCARRIYLSEVVGDSKEHYTMVEVYGLRSKEMLAGPRDVLWGSMEREAVPLGSMAVSISLIL